jgi:4-hydroxybenzoate polyprenyltransferase
MNLKPVRLAVAVLRPPLFALFLLFAAIGLAQAGHAEQIHPLFTVVALVVAGWFINAGAVNDLADELIDRVNFPGVGKRPLSSGQATRRQMLALALLSGAVSAGVAFAVNWRVGLVVLGALALSAAYSSPPIRISARGGLASFLLPAGYVAFPYLVGLFTVQESISAEQLVLLAGLWVAFIGRILLKDFRDVEGDAMFGKRTFLLRHGRRATCLVSAACWVAGAASLLLLVPPDSPLLAGFAVFVAAALYGLKELGKDNSRFEEWAIVAAIAMIGRGMAVTLLAYYSMLDLGHPAITHTGVTAGLTGLFVWVSWTIIHERKTPALAREESPVREQQR